MSGFFLNLLIYFLTLPILLLIAENKYCQLKCDYGHQYLNHTVCERQQNKCGPSAQCGPDFKVVKFTDRHRQYIIDLHNYLRNNVALGNENRGGRQPPAANMKIMSYNKEMEYIAQCWANACHGNPLVHDNCRRTANYPHVGQNLGFINSSIAKIDTYTSIKELTMLWYNEVAIFNSEWLKNTQDRGPNYKVGHYTQMLWADTQEIGCALSYYTSGKETKWYHVLFVCNYGPGGNYLGQPVYQSGKPASRCDNGLKQNKHYKGLCGISKRIVQTK